MRIAQLVLSLETGGLESIVASLCNGIEEQGHGCVVACVREMARDPSGLSCNAYWEGFVPAKCRFSFGALWRLCRFLRDERIDLIHCHNPKPLQYAVAASWSTGIPVVHTLHGIGTRGHYDGRRHTSLARFFYSRVSHVIAVSNATLLRARGEYGTPVERSTLIVNGVDTARFRPLEKAGGLGIVETRARLRAQLDLPQDAVLIASAGRFCPEKNYPLLVRAVAQLRASFPNVCLLLLGDGNERGAICQTIKANDLKSVCFLPGMRTDVDRWLRACDIFCLSSNTEGLPVTLLEAASTGLPAVVTDVGGNAEVVTDGENGLVVPPRDDKALSGALLELVRSPDMRKQMGLASRRTVELRYSEKRMIEKHMEIYEGIFAALRG